MTNASDQAERRAIFEADRLAKAEKLAAASQPTTYWAQAQADAEREGDPSALTGLVSPKLAAPNWAHDPVPQEPPLGFRVDDVPDLGFPQPSPPTSDEELTTALVRLAERTEFSIVEVFYMAKMIAQAWVDPLPAEEWGEPCDFARPRQPLLDLDDFSCINREVPSPDAQVDLHRAREEFEDDARIILRTLADRTMSPAMLCHAIVNQRDWSRFWAVRHWDPAQREKFSQGLAQAEAIAEDVVDRLRSAGIIPLTMKGKRND